MVIALFFIPQTRQPIQVFIHKGLALFSPSTIDEEKQVTLKSYDWKLKSTDGTLFNFEEVKGKVVLVNLWATWCPPCIAEMPSLQKLYDGYQDKIVFVFVSNEEPQVISAFLKENRYTFKVHNSISYAPEAFNVMSIPRTFLIDRYGAIVVDKTGAANWNSDAFRKTLEILLK